MNAVAALVTIGLVVGWIVLAAALAWFKFPATLAVLVFGTVAVFLYVPWVRLRAGAYERTSRPRRYWVNAAFIAVCTATASAFVWMLMRRLGLA